MPTIREEAIELSVGVVDAVEPGSPNYIATAFPLPSLHLTGAVELRPFRSVVLENDLVRAQIVPDLGGRLLSLVDKRTGIDALPPSPLKPESGNPRGAWLPAGVQFVLDAEDRPLSMAPLSTRMEREGDGEMTALWVAEMSGDLSFHTRFSLVDSGSLRAEVRVTNRSFYSVRYRAGFAIPPGDIEVLAFHHGMCSFSKPQNCGVSLVGSGAGFAAERLSDARHALLRASTSGTWLAPRQADSWSVSITPVTQMPLVQAASERGVLGLDDHTLSIQAIQSIEKARVVVRTTDGRTHELTATLGKGPPYQADVGSLGSAVTDVAVIDSGRREVVRFPHVETAQGSPNGAGPVALREDQLWESTGDTRLRAAAWCRLAQHSLPDDPAEAEARFEQALLYAADDPLAWWGKALARRQQGEAGERDELLNAHYLAPLEPVLRAEAFLSQPAGGKEPNPMLSSLRERPEDFVEVACLLIDHNLADDAARWIDESLRHVDLPILRYLQAALLLKRTRLQTEVAMHLAASAKLGCVGPFGWRDVEISALRELAQAFPDDRALSIFLGLCEQYHDQVRSRRLA